MNAKIELLCTFYDKVVNFTNKLTEYVQFEIPELDREKLDSHTAIRILFDNLSNIVNKIGQNVNGNSEIRQDMIIKGTDSEYVNIVTERNLVLESIYSINKQIRISSSQQQKEDSNCFDLVEIDIVGQKDITQEYYNDAMKKIFNITKVPLYLSLCVPTLTIKDSLPKKDAISVVTAIKNTTNISYDITKLIDKEIAYEKYKLPNMALCDTLIDRFNTMKQLPISTDFVNDIESELDLKNLGIKVYEKLGKKYRLLDSDNIEFNSFYLEINKARSKIINDEIIKFRRAELFADDYFIVSTNNKAFIDIMLSIYSKESKNKLSKAISQTFMKNKLYNSEELLIMSVYSYLYYKKVKGIIKKPTYKTILYSKEFIQALNNIYPQIYARTKD